MVDSGRYFSDPGSLFTGRHFFMDGLFGHYRRCITFLCSRTRLEIVRCYLRLIIRHQLPCLAKSLPAYPRQQRSAFFESTRPAVHRTPLHANGTGYKWSRIFARGRFPLEDPWARLPGRHNHRHHRGGRYHPEFQDQCSAGSGVRSCSQSGQYQLHIKLNAGGFCISCPGKRRRCTTCSRPRASAASLDT